MIEHDSAPAGPPPALWTWFRFAMLPLLALMAIATAIVLLRGSDDSGAAVRLKAGDLPAADGNDAAPERGRPAPDFTLTALDGTAYHLSDLRGQAVVLNFWATWCGPCRAEMPALDALHREKTADGVIVLAINVRESEAQARSYVNKLNLTLPVLLDTSGSVSRRYRIGALPTTYLIDRNGLIDGIRIGPYTRANLFGRVEQLLGGD